MLKCKQGGPAGFSTNHSALWDQLSPQQEYKPVLHSLLQLASSTSLLALCCGCSVPPSDSLQQREPVGLCDLQMLCLQTQG